MRSVRGDPRPDDHSMERMHPSDMCKTDWCGRHDYYRIVGTPVERQDPGVNPSFRMANVFAEGHQIHGKYQQWLWEMGILVGDFKCKECHHRWFARSPSECQFCRSNRLEYREYPLEHKVYMVEGHADGAVHLADARSLVEIKSIGINTLRFEAPRLYQRYLDGETAENIWFTISHPFGSHLRQAQLYLWMAWPVYEQITFIYESKFHQQVKEFVVGYNKNLISPIITTAREVSQAVTVGSPPSRPDWATGPEGRICTSCAYRNTCWGIDGHNETTPTPPLITVERASRSRRVRALGKTQLRDPGDT